MNKTVITLNGNQIPLTFGSWVMGQLIKEGHGLAEFQNSLANNPFDFIPLLVYLGAVNATESKDKEAYSVNQFYNWLDENGGLNSPEVAKVLKCFTTSLGVIEDPKAKKKDTQAIVK